MTWLRKEIKLYIFFGLLGLISIFIGILTDRSLCIFYNITGIPCPSCGMTRAYMQLIHGNIKDAFEYHPLFFTVILIPMIIKYRKNKLLYFMIGIFIITWIIRLILLFPDNEPMVYNNNSIVWFIYSVIN